MLEIRGTTIIAVERDGKIVVAGDGQVTAGQQVIMKNNAVKVRRIFDGKVIVGFAGTTADAFALSNHFEEMLQKYSGNLTRAAVELAGLWRNDKMLRQLNRYNLGKLYCLYESELDQYTLLRHYLNL